MMTLLMVVETGGDEQVKCGAWTPSMVDQDAVRSKTDGPSQHGVKRKTGEKENEIYNPMLLVKLKNTHKQNTIITHQNGWLW